MAEKAICFDMDGVLFDTERVCMEVWREIAGQRGIENVEEAMLGCVGLNRTDTKAFMAQKYGEEFPFDEFMRACGDRIKERMAAEGLPIKPGVYELLAWLKAEGYKIALASSTGYKVVMGHLEKAGIEAYFEVVIGGDMVEHSKPQPDIYLLACAKLGTQPSETYAIEDSPNGIRSAFAAGMKVIMVPDMIEPDMEIYSMLYRKEDSLLGVLKLLQLKETTRIPLKGAANTRDLGGYQAADGQVIKPCRLIRSGALYRTTEEDRQLLLMHGLKTIVDFRTEAERQSNPDPVIQGVAMMANPILEEETMGITRQSGDEQNVIGKMVKAIKESAGGPIEYMKNMYVNLITSPYSRQQYRSFFDILLAQEEGAVLWHCSAGKDRVGVGTALLLSALGVSREQIVADYMKTNEFGREEIDGLMEKLASHIDSSTPQGKDAALAIRLLFAVEEEYIISVFARMEEECGSVDAFLEREMGITPERRGRLRSMYLETE